MAAQTWPEWLSGLLSGLWPRVPPRPGSHEARLEEMRASALLNKELRKPAGQRDEELVHKLRVERNKLGLENAQVSSSGGWRGSGGRVEARCFAHKVPFFHHMHCVERTPATLPTLHAGREAQVQV